MVFNSTTGKRSILYVEKGNHYEFKNVGILLKDDELTSFFQDKLNVFIILLRK